MTDYLEEARMVRLRKNKVGDALEVSRKRLRDILWFHPNGQPIYLDYDQAATLRQMKRDIDEILERHKAAEEAL